MIYLAISILLSTIIICYTHLWINKFNIRYNAAISIIYDLVNKLNDTFPGSDLKVHFNGNVVDRVEGELKYLKKDD